MSAERASVELWLFAQRAKREEPAKREDLSL
jgi:hypothetical protein